jgi:hypothetical protein
MNLRSTLSILLVILVAASCAKQMVTVDPEETVRVYDAPLDTVGKVLLTLMAEYDLRVTGIETEEGVIRTDFHEFEADSDLGKAALQAYSSSEQIEKGRYRLDIYFFEIDENSVKVAIECTVEKFSGTHSAHNFHWQSQPSNGEIETRVFATLEERLRQQGFID